MFHILLGKRLSLGNRRNAYAHKALVSDFFKRHSAQLEARQDFLDILYRKIKKLGRRLYFIKLSFSDSGRVYMHIANAMLIQIIPVIVYKPCRTGGLCDFMAVPEYEIYIPVQLISVL